MPLSRIESQLQSIKSHIDAYTTTKEGEKFAVFQCNRDYFLRAPLEFTQAGLTVEDICPGEHNHLTYLLLLDRDGKRITNTDQINHETIAILLDNTTSRDPNFMVESRKVFGENKVGFFWNRLRAPTVHHGKCEVGRCAFTNIKNAEVTDWDSQGMNSHPNRRKAKIAEMKYYF